MTNIDYLKQYQVNNAVITQEGLVYSYKNLIDISDTIYNNIKHRSLVFCLCKNQIGALSGYISFITNRVVPLMLDASLDKRLLDELIIAYKPEFLWLPNDRMNEFPNGYEIFSILGYSLLKIESDSYFYLHDNLALLLTTSGSTGSPKLVRISYENLEVNALSIAEYLSIDENERPITTLPMNYSFGLSIINSHLIKGATILLTSNSMIENEFWTFLKENKGTSLSGVPFTFELLNKLGFFRMDLPSLKTLTQAGGNLNKDLNKVFVEFCKQSDRHFVIMYGQTEATARMSYLPSQYSLSKSGSIGVPIPGGAFSLIDESGELIEESDFTGELVYKGKNVSMGYAECGLDLKKEDENHGILFTGDLAKRDNENFYYIVGRKNRFIKLFGNSVNLDDTERLLKNILPECACIGEDDNMLIYITDRTKLKEVRKYISSITGINHASFTIKFIDAIPKDPSGKTIYSKLAFS